MFSMQNNAIITKLLLISLVFQSFCCTVQKRIAAPCDQGDFYVSSFHSAKKIGEKIIPREKKDGHENLSQKKSVPDVSDDQQIYTSAEKNILPFVVSKQTRSFIHPPDTCDLLTFKDGKEARVKILEISKAQIKYKKCNMADGPLYVINKSELFMIAYSNGTKEVIMQETLPQTQNSPGQQNYDQTEEPAGTALATTALVFSILGFYPLWIVGSFIGLILSLIYLTRANANPEHYSSIRHLKGIKKAKAAFTLSIIGLFIGGIILALLIISV
jgi:hypothetical protein